MFTLLVCLVVVVLSGAAVIRVTMGSSIQPATGGPRRHRRPAGAVADAGGDLSDDVDDGSRHGDVREPAEGSTGGDGLGAPHVAADGDEQAGADEPPADVPPRPAAPASPVAMAAAGPVVPASSAPAGMAAGVPAATATSPVARGYERDEPDERPGRGADPEPAATVGAPAVRRARSDSMRARGWRRIRSVVMLFVVVAIVGALLALVVGLAAAVFSLGLRDAVTS